MNYQIYTWEWEIERSRLSLDLIISSSSQTKLGSVKKKKELKCYKIELEVS